MFSSIDGFGRQGQGRKRRDANGATAVREEAASRGLGRFWMEAAVQAPRCSVLYGPVFGTQLHERGLHSHRAVPVGHRLRSWCLHAAHLQLGIRGHPQAPRQGRRDVPVRGVEAVVVNRAMLLRQVQCQQQGSQEGRDTLVHRSLKTRHHGELDPNGKAIAP